MLTDIQTEKLNNLRGQYPQYDHLIDRMIEGWKVTKPSPGSYGIDWFSPNEILGPMDENCTCLLGACIIGLKSKGSPGERFDNALEQLNIMTQRIDITRGFDGDLGFYDEIPYQFAQEVRKIVL